MEASLQLFEEVGGLEVVGHGVVQSGNYLLGEYDLLLAFQH
jgi:hypothetical protein